MHTQVDLVTTLQVVTPILAILLGVNGYFIRGLVVKIEETARLAASSAEKIDRLEKEMVDTRDVFSKVVGHISQIDSDVAVLKFAILKELKRRDGAPA